MVKKFLCDRLLIAIAFSILALLCIGIFQTAQASSENSEPELSLQEIIDDMSLDNEINPHRSTQIDTKASIEAGNTPPSGWEAITIWGSAYEGVSGTKSNNVLVAVKEPKLYIFSKSKNQWIELVNKEQQEDLKTANLPLLSGEMFVERFAKPDRYPLDAAWIQKDGSLAAKPGQGLMFHFWPASGRVSLYSENNLLDEDDILGIFVTFLGRLVLEDESGVNDLNDAVFVMRAGADYWKNVSLDPNQSTGVGYGRYKLVTPEWRHFNFCTLSAEELAVLPLPPGVKDLSSAPSANEGQRTPEESNNDHGSEGKLNSPKTGEEPLLVIILLSIMLIASVAFSIQKRIYRK